MNDQHKVIQNFIQQFQYCALATVSANGKPENATIEFVCSDQFEIIFDTLHQYRKYKNMKTNPNVAVVIGWDARFTVQLEGVARELRGEELHHAQQLYFQKFPDAQKWSNNPDVSYFKVSPKWLRYGDWAQYPPKNIEIDFTI